MSKKFGSFAVTYFLFDLLFHFTQSLSGYFASHVHICFQRTQAS